VEGQIWTERRRAARFRLDSTGEEIEVTPEIVAIAGYTGRNQEAVRRHVAELAAHGIAAPPRVPMVYAVTRDRGTIHRARLSSSSCSPVARCSSA
jgi:hypothetical protein